LLSHVLNINALRIRHNTNASHEPETSPNASSNLPASLIANDSDVHDLVPPPMQMQWWEQQRREQ
jgi:hypothetical protein